VAATRVEGVDEVITDGENGLLITPEDAAGLAEALLRLLEDAELRGKLSRVASACARSTTVDTMCTQYARWLILLFRRVTMTWMQRNRERLLRWPPADC
jgi:glycosyltransferase involved in cell wall biosynthesis